MARLDPAEISRADFLLGDYSAITPSDETVFDPPIAGIWVGTGGHVTVENWLGHAAQFKNVPSGTLLKVTARKVLAATTALDLVGGR